MQIKKILGNVRGHTNTTEFFFRCTLSLKSNDDFKVAVDEQVDSLPLGITHPDDKISSIRWLYFEENYFIASLTAKVNIWKTYESSFRYRDI